MYHTKHVQNKINEHCIIAEVMYNAMPTVPLSYDDYCGIENKCKKNIICILSIGRSSMKVYKMIALMYREDTRPCLYQVFSHGCIMIFRILLTLIFMCFKLYSVVQSSHRRPAGPPQHHSGPYW